MIQISLQTPLPKGIDKVKGENHCYINYSYSMILLFHNDKKHPLFILTDNNCETGINLEN